MAGNVTLKQGTTATLESNGGTLATASVVAASSTYDNSANDNFWAGFELNTGFAVAPSVGTSIELYLVPALDGSNYADVDTGTPTMPLPCFVGAFAVVKSQTGAQRLVITGVPLMARLYKAYLYNKAGQTMSSGWTLKLFPDYEQYT
jgi:hypothetical protein